MLTVAQVHRLVITRSKADLRATLPPSRPACRGRPDAARRDSRALRRRRPARADPAAEGARHGRSRGPGLRGGVPGLALRHAPRVRSASGAARRYRRLGANSRGPPGVRVHPRRQPPRCGLAAADRRTAAKAELERCGDQAIRSRVLQRLAYSAYMASEVAEATDLALAAARASDACGDYGAVAAAYRSRTTCSTPSRATSAERATCRCASPRRRGGPATSRSRSAPSSHSTKWRPTRATKPLSPSTNARSAAAVARAIP